MHRVFRISHTEFMRLSKEKPRRIHGIYFAVAIFPFLAGKQGPKAACVVSKKISPKAVIRNRIRRRCRECIRTNSFLMDTHHTYVFYAKKTASVSTFSEIKADIHALIEKTGH